MRMTFTFREQDVPAERRMPDHRGGGRASTPGKTGEARQPEMTYRRYSCARPFQRMSDTSSEVLALLTPLAAQLALPRQQPSQGSTMAAAVSLRSMAGQV